MTVFATGFFFLEPGAMRFLLIRTGIRAVERLWTLEAKRELSCSLDRPFKEASGPPNLFSNGPSQQGFCRFPFAGFGERNGCRHSLEFVSQESHFRASL